MRALREEPAAVRTKMEAIEGDPTTPDTRPADCLLDLHPARSDERARLTLGGFLAGCIRILHSLFRYCDPACRRTGLPPDVGALVKEPAANSATLTLVHLSPIEPRTATVQADS